MANCEREHRELLRAWRGWGRHYHSAGHLEACLSELDGALNLAERPAEVEMAIWFHDAIYRAYRSDNEARSAQWAADFLSTGGCDSDTVSRVRGLVLATAHNPGELSGDAALTVDIDLSILGQPAAVYDVFERNVRREYWWVPKRRYAAARCNVLGSFLERPAIFRLGSFRERYEQVARANLERAIRSLAVS